MLFVVGISNLAWMHHGMAECRVLFMSHYDLDL